MKNNKHAFMIAAAAMLLAIGVISLMSIVKARRDGYYGGSFAFSLGGVAKLRNTIEIPLEKAEYLKLEYNSKNIKVYPAKDGQITVKEYLYSRKKKALAEVSYSDKGEALVRGGESRSLVLFGFFVGEGERIEVYIPEKSLAALSLQTGSGNITLSADCARQEGLLEVKAGSGNVEIENAEAKEISLETNSGNIKAQELTGESIRFQAGSGNVRGEGIAGTIYADTGSGNIRLEKLSGGGKVSAGSGNVTLEAESLSGDMECETGSGNIKLELPKEPGFYFEGGTGSGNIDTNFDESLSYNKKGKNAGGNVGESPAAKVTARTGSGNIDLAAF
ncbi:MAG: DUF4097 domain-containing protein [Clostridium sp.]|nr:DUF4097 domain-containing protein [Clostridium sp.]